MPREGCPEVHEWLGSAYELVMGSLDASKLFLSMDLLFYFDATKGA